MRRQGPRSAISSRRCASAAPFSISPGNISPFRPLDFQKAYIETLCKIQNGLGYQGYAPVASNDTDNADKHRAAYVRDQPVAANKLL